MPVLQLAHAVPQPCETHGAGGGCSEFWYPAGSEMDTKLITISGSSTAEYNCILQSNPCLDFPDSTVPAAAVSTCTASTGLYLTAATGGGQYCYVRCQVGPCGAGNNWTRIVNDDSFGLPNYFTWLNAHTGSPAAADTMRQGFSSTTSSVNPYIARSVQDSYIVQGIYDSLAVQNPLSHSQLINWMVYSNVQESNMTVMTESNYTTPAGTLTTYHFTLRNDIFFQDGRPVTAYDVAFSYLSEVGSGAFFGNPASSMTGITVLSPRTFDIGVNSLGVFTLPNLVSIPIVPGRYWTGIGSSAWDIAVAACTGTVHCATAQYSLSGPTVTCPAGLHPGCTSFPANNMQIDPAKTAAAYDPIANHILVGSGPWECGPVSALGSGLCSSSGTENPPLSGTYTLTRFGAGLLPASSISGIYFRSSGDLALYIWTEENDINPIAAVSAVSLCFNQPQNPQCFHWQHGIGSCINGIVCISAIAAVTLRYNLNWVSPFEWATNPPLGIGVLPPVLYEGSITLNPCSVDSVNGYDC